MERKSARLGIIMKKYVNALSLNIRSAPVVDPANKLGVLFLGQPVEVLGATNQPGWVQVSADMSGGRIDGFVAEKFLRNPASDTRELLIAACVREWMRFGRGLGKEHVDPFYKFVGEMWRAIGINLDGRDRDVPWSAAAISFMARNAGPAYSRFKFAAAHARYIHQSIAKRDANDVETPFWGFRLHERRPQLGDLVCRWREVEVDYEAARLRDDFKSHCDIVVRIDSEKNEVLAIGGNVSQSVSTTTYKLTAGDFLADSDSVFALLANIADRGLQPEHGVVAERSLYEAPGPIDVEPTDEASEEIRAPSADAAAAIAPAVGVMPAAGPLSYEVQLKAQGYEATPSDGRPAFFVGRATVYPRRPGPGVRQRKGLFQHPADLARLTQFGIYDRHKEATRHPEWAFAIWPSVLAESGGYYGRINSYDRALYTYGFYQLAAHTPDENLILLFRRLLQLPSASRFFPDLVLKTVGGKSLVHLRRGNEFVNLEVKNANDDLGRFMRYLNSDDQRIDEAELRASTRLLDWTQLEESARDTQVDTGIEIAAKKLKAAVTRSWDPAKPLSPRLAIWISDIRHQGRGTRRVFEFIRAALQSDDPEAQLRRVPGTVASRVSAVNKGLEDLDNDGFLDQYVYVNGEFIQRAEA
jgi:Uncharacterized protein conserved in bacteria (DUF2272)/Bacterial SH3 domain